MAIIGMRELLRDPRKVFSVIEDDREPVLVTNYGRPVAVMRPVDESQAEDLMLATDPQYVASRNRAEHARAEGRTRSLEDAIQEYNASADPEERIDLEADPSPERSEDAAHWVRPETSSASGALGDLVPMTEMQAIFGTELADKVAGRAEQRVLEVSQSLLRSAEGPKAPGSEEQENAEQSGGSEAGTLITILVGTLFGEALREVLLQTATQRVAALQAGPAETLESIEPDGMFGERLAQETLETADAWVSRFNEEILTTGPFVELDALVTTYAASIHGATTFGRVAPAPPSAAPVSSQGPRVRGR